mmetsp:Transcript_8168/g.19910  ORF Transcript_8168/g.19910 Transcript_8168/m.19910 type:complete len:204 (+) Transcript_8168:1852-2463(+)
MRLDALRLEEADRHRRAEHRRRAAHVEFHELDHRAGSRLDVVPARVKGQPLANDGHLALSLALAFVQKVDELGRLARPLGHSEERAHPKLLTLVLFEDLAGEPRVVFGNLHRHVSEGGGGDVVGRRRDKVARQSDARGKVRRPVEDLPRVASEPDESHGLQRRGRCLLRGRLEAPVLVHPELHRLRESSNPLDSGGSREHDGG